MLSTFIPNTIVPRPSTVGRTRLFTFALAAMVLAGTPSTPAGAQIAFGGSLPGDSFLCSTNGAVRFDDNDCEGISASATYLQFGSGSGTVTFNANGTANFSQTTVQMSGLQAYSGTSTFNSTVSFVGPSVTFDTGTAFQDPATFNGTTDFNAGMTTTDITNSGTVSSNIVSATTVGAFQGTFTNLRANGTLFTPSGTLVSFGGNVIHGVGAGTFDGDAVNVAQLNAATSGVTTRVETLEAVAVFHDLEITAVQEVNAAQDTRLSAVEGVNNAQASQITSLQGTTANQASQITAIQALNSTQSSQITALQAAQDLVSDRVDTLFDLRGMDRRDMKRGIAAAMSMAPAPMPSQPGRVAYAVNGATFRGEYAVGGSMTYSLNTRAPMALNVGFSYAGNKNNGARVGIAGEF